MAASLDFISGRPYLDAVAAGPPQSDGARFFRIAGVAQLVRAPACHAGGRGFKSRRSRHYFNEVSTSVSAVLRLFGRRPKTFCRFLFSQARSSALPGGVCIAHGSEHHGAVRLVQLV